MVQIFCVLSIAFVKIKYFTIERNQQHFNASRRIHPMEDERKTAPNITKPTHSKDTVELRVRCKKNNDNNETQHPPNEQKSINLNTVAYNKVLVEVYQIAFLTLALAIGLATEYVKRDLRIKKAEEYPLLMLYFLDLLPRILVSLVLPICVHLCNPEIQKYIKRLFYK